MCIAVHYQTTDRMQVNVKACTAFDVVYHRKSTYYNLKVHQIDITS